MGLLDQFPSLKAAFSYLPMFSGAQGHMFGAAQPTYKPMDVSGLLDRGMKLYAFLCADINARGVCSIPLKLYTTKSTSRFETNKPTKKDIARLEKWRAERGYSTKDIGGATEVIDYPALKVLQRPMMWHVSGRNLKYILQWHKEIVGNGFMCIVPEKLPGVGKVPSQLVWMLPDQVDIQPDEKEFIKGYYLNKYQPNEKFFSAQEVIHMKNPHPRNYWWGFSRLQAALWPSDRSYAMAVYKQSLYENGCRPDFLIQTEDEWQKPQKERFREEVRQLCNGRGAGNFMILDPGTQLKEASFSPRDVGLIAEAKFDRDEICNIMNVPTSMVDMSANRATAEEDTVRWRSMAILPRCLEYEDDLNLQYLPWFDEEAAESGELFFAHDDPVPENVQLRLSTLQTRLTTGLTSINEEREKDNMEPIEGGDEPLVNPGLAPLSKVASGQAAQAAQPQPPGAGGEGDVPGSEEAQKPAKTGAKPQSGGNGAAGGPGGESEATAGQESASSEADGSGIEGKMSHNATGKGWITTRGGRRVFLDDDVDTRVGYDPARYEDANDAARLQRGDPLKLRGNREPWTVQRVRWSVRKVELPADPSNPASGATEPYTYLTVVIDATDGQGQPQSVTFGGLDAFMRGRDAAGAKKAIRGDHARIGTTQRAGKGHRCGDAHGVPAAAGRVSATAARREAWEGS